MADLDPIIAKLKTKRTALGKLDRDREVLLIEIKTLEDVVRMLQPPVPALSLEVVEPTPEQMEQIGLITEVAEPDPERQKRTRGLSTQWKAILGHLAKAYPGTLDYDDLAIAATIEGRELPKPSLRKAMMSHVHAELVERVSDGQFRMTSRGAEVLGVPLGSGEAPDASTSEASRINGAGAGAQGFLSSTPAGGSTPLRSTPLERKLLSSASLPLALSTPFAKGG